MNPPHLFTWNNLTEGKKKWQRQSIMFSGCP